MKKNEIIRSYGTGFKEMTIRLLEAAGLYEDIIEKTSGKDVSKIHIGIKPNLVTPSPASFGATTHPEIAAGIIEYLQENGFCNITIAEGSWVGDKTSDAFEYCGYNALAAEYGVNIIDTKKDSCIAVDVPGAGPSLCGGAPGARPSPCGEAAARMYGAGSGSADLKLNVCSCVGSFDYLINVPVIKGHCQTHMTCALKNMKGLIPDSEKRRFHRLGLHRPVAFLNTCIHQDFIVIDHICGDPSFEEGGNPLVRNCIMAAKDPVLADAFACSLLGVDISSVEYIRLAEKLGVGSADLTGLKLVTLEGDPTEDTGYGADPLDVSYAVDEVDSCSACYASLVPSLARLREEGLLEKLDCRIGIGQGHQGKSGRLGVGKCTAGFDCSIKGCPPDEEEIYNGLKAYLSRIG